MNHYSRSGAAGGLAAAGVTQATQQVPEEEFK
jgi:hypothetical protein